ncbi:hypothetical protein [Vibrio brasiliensis]|uniref:hypothetical protein n=1 Tax=Vibrio brasiliensis TaxID=170652 RepID=UPI001EFD226C|nr:hypothetical protein [Vibrio brasiliensis]MCG9724352.1 hypothetical protein [Vibrio brasiliensis]
MPTPCYISIDGETQGLITAGACTADSIGDSHCQDPAMSDFTQNLTVSMSYRKITWDHVNAGTSGSDDWRKPVEA